MDYHEASNIRDKSLTDMIARKLVNDKSFATSLKESISEKTQANVKGYKEKFDILNIAKILTGGSSLGPAVLGRMIGRSDEDMSYFAGISPRKDAQKLSLEKQEQTPTGQKPAATSKQDKEPFTTTISPGRVLPIKRGDSAANLIGKIYNLLKKQYDDNLLAKELAQDFAMQRKIEVDKRHKEFIQALSGIKVGKGGKKTAESEEDGPLKTLINNVAKDALEVAGGVAGERIIGRTVLKKGLGRLGVKIGGKIGDRILKHAGYGAMTKAEKFALTLGKKDTAKLAEKGIRYSEKAGNFFMKGKKGAVKVADVAKSIGKELPKELTKSATKIVAKNTIKQSLKKILTKEGLGVVLKKLPALGLGVGAIFAISRIMEGDYAGATAELASGAAGGSGVGIAGSALIDVGLIARDVYKEQYGTYPEKDDSAVASQRIKEIKEIISEEMGSSTATKEQITPAQIPNINPKTDIAPAKSPMSGMNPQLQPDPDVKTTTKTSATITPTVNTSKTTTITVPRPTPNLKPNNTVSSNKPIIIQDTTNNNIGKTNQVVSGIEASPRNDEMTLNRTFRKEARIV